MTNHLLVTYSAKCADSGHIDPNFTKLIYGNSNKNGGIIKNNVNIGSYVFFNARIGVKRYITAYFHIEKILIKGTHDSEIETLSCDAKYDEVIIVGSRDSSKILTIPLEFNETVIGLIKSCGADENYFAEKHKDGSTIQQAISDKTLIPRLVTETEKDELLSLLSNRG